MSIIDRTAQLPLTPNFLLHRLLHKKIIMQHDRSISVKNGQIYANAVQDFAMVISRFSHKWGRVGMGKSTWHQRKIQERFVR